MFWGLVYKGSIASFQGFGVHTRIPRVLETRMRSSYRQTGIATTSDGFHRGFTSITNVKDTIAVLGKEYVRQVYRHAPMFGLGTV